MLDSETKCNIFFLIMLISLVVNLIFIIHNQEVRCFDKDEPIYLGSNLTIHNDVENTYWDNLRCSFYTDNIVCAEAWGEPSE